MITTWTPCVTRFSLMCSGELWLYSREWCGFLLKDSCHLTFSARWHWRRLVFRSFVNPHRIHNGNWNSIEIKKLESTIESPEYGEPFLLFHKRGDFLRAITIISLLGISTTLWLFTLFSDRLVIFKWNDPMLFTHTFPFLLFLVNLSFSQSSALNLL